MKTKKQTICSSKLIVIDARVMAEARRQAEDLEMSTNRLIETAIMALLAGDSLCPPAIKKAAEGRKKLMGRR